MIENYEEPKKSLESQLDSDMDSRWSEPATRGDLRFAFTHTEIKFDSLHHHIETKFLEIEQLFGETKSLHQLQIVIIVLGFIGIILNLR